MSYQYKAIEFIAVLKGGIVATKGTGIDRQFEDFISSNTKDGWEFYRLDTVHAYVKSGCLAALLGRKDEVWQRDIAIFRKQL